MQLRCTVGGELEERHSCLQVQVGRIYVNLLTSCWLQYTFWRALCSDAVALTMANELANSETMLGRSSCESTHHKLYSAIKCGKALFNWACLHKGWAVTRGLLPSSA